MPRLRVYPLQYAKLTETSSHASSTTAKGLASQSPFDVSQTKLDISSLVGDWRLFESTSSSIMDFRISTESKHSESCVVAASGSAKCCRRRSLSFSTCLPKQGSRLLASGGTGVLIKLAYWFSLLKSFLAMVQRMRSPSSIRSVQRFPRVSDNLALKLRVTY